MIYDFSTKRHWRRTVWNLFRDALGTARRDAVVFYLAGADDEDRQIAIEKGFGRHNLIAVERDPTAAVRLRRGGALTLCGDIFGHLMALPPTREVGAVHLDFCGGLTSKTQHKLLEVLMHPALKDAVFAVNLLRGRDKSGNAHRSAIRDVLTDRFALDTKHRGALLWGLLVYRFEALLRARPEVVSDSPPMVARGLEFSPHESRVLSGSRIAELSYRSTAHQTFDTLVFRNPAGRLFPDGMRRALSAALDREFASCAERKQQAAVMAHRTRRLGVTA